MRFTLAAKAKGGIDDELTPAPVEFEASSLNGGAAIPIGDAYGG